MLKEHATAFRRLMIFADTCIVIAAFYLGYFFRDRFGGLSEFGFYFSLLPVLVVVWSALLYFFGMYRSFRTKSVLEILFIVFKSALIGFVLFASYLYIFKVTNISRVLIASVFILTTVLISLEKMLVVVVFHYVRKKGYNVRHVLLVGTGRRAQNFIALVERHSEWGLKIVGLVDDEPEKVGQQVKGYKVFGVLSDIPDIVHENVVDEVVFVVPGSWLRKIESIILACETEGVKVHVAVDVYEPKFARTKLNELHKFPLITFESTPDKIGQLVFKRLFDIAFSVGALIFLAPVFLTVAALIQLTSRGPVFFLQKRYGLNGRKLILYKFRTMEADAHVKLADLMDRNEMKGPAFKLENDPRVTRLGKFLRKASLDEIPQFWNVLKGDMSLIGPRPPIPAEVDRYDPWHRKRLRMRPGITCLWQVNGRNKITDFDDWARLDVSYIENWSLMLDLKILLKTVPVVLFGIGAK